MLKKALALVLAFTLIFSVMTVSVYAEDEVTATASSSTEDILNQYLNMFLDKFVQFILSYLNLVIPKEDWPSLSEYVPTDFYTGTADFDAQAENDGNWNVGYASASLLEGQDILDGKHYMGGQLVVDKPKVATGIIDDQRVRTFAISDGSDGIAVFAVIDGYALCSGDVNSIRALLRDFAVDNNIVSINVSVLHQHSCVDTLGMNGELFLDLFNNTAVHAGLMEGDILSGRNPEFMANLHQVTAQTIKDAVADMKPGTLYYGNVDASDFIHDKREPNVFDPNLNRLRFDPDDQTVKDTWIVSAGIHYVGMGTDSVEVTGDYPYYIDKAVKEKYDANLVLINGAQLAISINNIFAVEGNTRIDNCAAFGVGYADRLNSISNEEIVSPLLNIRFTKVYFPVSAQVLTLAANVGLFATTVAVNDDGTYVMISEMGYLEIGDKLAISTAPGEIDPAIVYGGVTAAEDTWTGESWTYPSMQDYIAATGRKLLVWGLMNDEVGYILADNDYRSMFTENEEINASSDKAGSTAIKAFMAMYDEIYAVPA